MSFSTRPVSPSRAIIFYGLLSWIPFVLVFPLISLILGLFTLYRSVVIILALLFKRAELIRPVTGLDISFSTDTFFQKHPHGALGFIQVLNGKLSPELVTDRIQKVLAANKTNNGYEKLTSVYPVFWMGYPFWKKACVPFDIKNHINVIEHNGFTRSHELNKLVCKWMQEPFAQNLPLWEVRIVPEITLLLDENIPSDPLESPTGPSPCPDSITTLHSPVHPQSQCHSAVNRYVSCGPQKGTSESHEVKSILVLKTHHVIGDGNSMLQFLNKIFDTDNGPVSTSVGEGTDSSLASGMQNNTHKTIDAQISNSKLEMRKVHKQKSVEITSCHHPYPQRDEQHNEIIVKMDESGEKIGSTTSSTLKGRKGDADSQKFPIFKDSSKKSSIIKAEGATLHNCVGLARSHLTWVKHVATASFLFRLSHSILLVFWSPLVLLSLLKDFAIHRDSWFTQKKVSHRSNLASAYIPMKGLSVIRKDLCGTYPRPSSSAKRELEIVPPVKRHNLNGTENTFPFEEESKANNAAGATAKASLQRGYQANPPPQSQVPLVVVVVSAFAGALRNLLVAARSRTTTNFEKHFPTHYYGNSGTIKQGSTNGGKPTFSLKEEEETSTKTAGIRGEVPTSANFVVALPLHKRHPGNTKFCNFWTHGILQVKMREINCFRRLHSLNNCYWKMQSQRSPEIYHSLVKFHSLLPEPILRLVANYNMGASIGVTNLAGSPIPVFIGGRRVLRKYAYFGLQWRHASMTLALISYNGEIAATVLANESVIPTQEDVELLLQKYFINELSNLKLKGQHVGHL